MEAPSRSDARQALERFREEFDAKYPKAIAKLDRDWQHLTAFYEFPAEHWRHLRTSNAIESNSKPDTPRGRNQEAGSDSDEGHPGRSLQQS